MLKEGVRLNSMDWVEVDKALQENIGREFAKYMDFMCSPIKPTRKSLRKLHGKFLVENEFTNLNLDKEIEEINKIRRVK
jgi:hypothetical protein